MKPPSILAQAKAPARSGDMAGTTTGTVSSIGTESLAPLVRTGTVSPTASTYPTFASTEISSAALAAEPSYALPEWSPAAFDTFTTDTFLTDTLFLDTMEFEDWDSTVSEMKGFSLPDSPLPPDELDLLTSSTRKASRITLMAAICRTLECNQNLRVERLRPEVSNTSIQSAESAFDTNLTAQVFQSTRHSSTLGAESRDDDSTGSNRREEDESVSRSTEAQIGLNGRLPTGTNYSIGLSTRRTWTNSSLPFYNSALNLGITQNLLRGAGTKVNCLRVWTAQNNFVISLYQLQQTLINVTNEVQVAYWDLYLALVTLEIRREAYRVAREQRERTEEFVRVGKSPPLEALAALAEESSRVSDIINAAADVKQNQLSLLRLLNPEGYRQGWKSLVYPAEDPILPQERLEPEDHIRIARYYRPDLRQAQIDLSNGELEVVRTENGLLPVLDFVSDVDFTGSGDTFPTSMRKVKDRDFPSWRVGLQFSYPLQNRAARADYRRANFQRQVAEEAIANYCQIIELDVRSAIINIERTARLIDSTEVTLRLRREELAAEIEKFRVGRSTQLLVAQAQRDLTTAQLAEISAKIANIKSYLQLYRAEGSTLQRCGIQPIHITAASGVPKD